MPAANPPATPQDLAALHPRLLAAILDPQLTLAALAEMFGLLIVDIARWFNHPDTQADLDLIRNLARDRAQLLADLQLPAAVDTLIILNDRLTQLQPATEEPITTHLRLADTIRKTTTALQRFASKSTPGTANLQSSQVAAAPRRRPTDASTAPAPQGEASHQTTLSRPTPTGAPAAPAPQGQPQAQPHAQPTPKARDRPAPHAAAA